ncbi:MAG: type II toxin-antitoxin system RelE/ParE family toxin [Oscillospiraceae bacterium]|nr:type II toxin-antitoxin system RelE/ParE family toxin [Oscillospiraceae bacterium]
MSYKVLFTEKAAQTLKKMDKQTAKLITAWIRKNLEGCENPRLHGKGLVSNRSGQWRYRIGDYRLIADIQDDKIIILILEIGHRREIYS